MDDNVMLDDPTTLLQLSLAESTWGGGGSGQWDTGGQKLAPKHKSKRRARVLKDGQLSMIVYGFSEKILW